MRKVPSTDKQISDRLPHLGGCGSLHVNILQLIMDGFADLQDGKGNGVMGHPEVVHETMIRRSC